MEDVFVVSIEDVQCLAEYEISRRLTTGELEQVKKEVASGLELWGSVVVSAIKNNCS